MRRAWPGEHIQSQAKTLKFVLKVELTPRLWGAVGGFREMPVAFGWSGLEGEDWVQF